MNQSLSLNEKSIPELNFPGWMEMHACLIVVTNPEGKTLWVNQSFQEVCGHTREELFGRKPGEVLQMPETDPNMKRLLSYAVHNGEALQLDGLLNRHKNGTSYLVDLNLEPVKDDNNKIVYFVAVEKKHDPRGGDPHPEMRALLTLVATELRHKKHMKKVNLFGSN
jgi:PAS domain S-box-containing protein